MKKNTIKEALFLTCLLIFSCQIITLAEENKTADEQLCEHALKDYRSGNTAAAINQLNQALQINPDNKKAGDYLNKITQDGKTSHLTPENKKFGKLSISVNPRFCIYEPVNFYSKSIAPDASYEWDFGDGTQADGEEVKKIYSQPGIYIVRLTQYAKTADRPIIARASKMVTVYSPPIAEAGDDINVCLGESVLLDGTKSKVTNSIERCLGCAPLGYTWDFGDGSPKIKKAKVKHLYRNPRRYKATLKVKDGKVRKCANSEDTTIVSVNTAPDIVIRQMPLGCPEKEVNFSAFMSITNLDSPNKEYLTYTWDFGDGTVEEGGANITHIYQEGGEYLVQANTDDRLGTGCSQSKATLKIKINNPPLANAGPNLVCCSNVESIFDGSGSYDADADNLSYIWDFGDGATANGEKVTHVYTKNGDYKVILTVDDNSKTPCSSSTSSFMATVHREPVSIIKIIRNILE